MALWILAAGIIINLITTGGHILSPALLAQQTLFLVVATTPDEFFSEYLVFFEDNLY